MDHQITGEQIDSDRESTVILETGDPRPFPARRDGQFRQG